LANEFPTLGGPHILAIGDIAWDILIRPASAFVWGSDVFGAVRLSPGGSAANFAVWASREGARVTLAGKVGDDPLGVLMRAHLDRERVTGITTVAGAETTRVAALVSPDGERAFITDEATLIGFSTGDIPPAALTGAAVLFVNGYAIFTSGSADFLAPVLAEARSRRIPIAFDPSSFELVRRYGAERLLDEVGPMTLLLVNEEEAAALTPGDPAALLDRAEIVVLKRGRRGAAALTRDATVALPAVDVTAVDTTGAGDAFDAGLVVEYVRSGNVATALANGNRLGALVASHLGAQPSAPRR